MTINNSDFHYYSEYWNPKSIGGLAILSVLGISLLAFGILSQMHSFSVLPEHLGSGGVALGSAMLLTTVALASFLAYKANRFKITHPKECYNDSFEKFKTETKEKAAACEYFPFPGGQTVDSSMVCVKRDGQYKAHIYRGKNGMSFFN